MLWNETEVISNPKSPAFSTDGNGEAVRFAAEDVMSVDIATISQVVPRWWSILNPFRCLLFFQMLLRRGFIENEINTQAPQLYNQCTDKLVFITSTSQKKKVVELRKLL